MVITVVVYLSIYPCITYLSTINFLELYIRKEYYCFDNILWL